MKKLVIIGVVTYLLVASFFAMSCGPAVEGRQKKPWHDKLVESLRFSRHENGLCFAVGWSGTFQGGPIMTLVPTEYCLEKAKEK